MKRERFDEYLNQEMVGFDLAPMIDIVFLLLIFFVSSTVVANEAGIKIDKPTAASAEPQEKKSMQFAIDEQGHLYHDGRPCSLNSVRGLVHRKLQSSQSSVLIMADKNVTTRKLVELMDEIKLGGATSISLAAINER